MALLLVGCSNVTPGGHTLRGLERPRIVDAYGRLPFAFEANRGQTDAAVTFLARGHGYTLLLTDNEAVFVLRHTTVLRMKLIGVNPAPRVVGLEELPGKVNYFRGNDPTKWRTNIPTFAKVKYAQVYPGVDLVYYGRQGRLEHDFIVAPGADPRSIELAFEGTDRLELTSDGEVILHVARGELRLQKPGIYQDVEGVRKEISGRFVLLGHGHRAPPSHNQDAARHGQKIGFEVAAYDARRPLVIDPVLVYSTFLGGSDVENAYPSGAGIAIDGSGNAYVTGSTRSSDFPTLNPVQPHNNSKPSNPTDVYVTKLNPAGTALVYSTYLGGSQDDYGYGIAIDATGSAYVVGETHSPDFPTTPGAFQTTFAGYSSAFVTKLSPDGSQLMYSTYLGGGGQDTGRGVAVDAVGNAYVTGTAGSKDFPTTPGAFQQVCPRSLYVSWCSDAFVTKLNPAGSALVYSTHLGGSNTTVGEGGNAIAVDAVGNAYVAGVAGSGDFPTTPGAFQPHHPGIVPGQGFVTKFNATGSALVYSTFLGGTFSTGVSGIAVDTAGNAYVTGATHAGDFPVTPGAFQTTFGGAADGFVTHHAFVTKFKVDGSGLVYSTFLGGSGTADEAFGIAVDAQGNAYVTGRTVSDDFPTAHPIQAARNHGVPTFCTLQGCSDAFVTKLNATGTGLVYSTFLGGLSGDEGMGIAADTAGNAYVTGFTPSIDFPVTPEAFQPTNHGHGDAFIAKIADRAAAADLTVSKTDSPHSVMVGQKLTYTVVVTNNGPELATWVMLTDTLPSTVSFVSSSASQGSCSGSRVITCSLGTLANGGTATVTIVVTPTAVGAISNTATASADTPDPNPDNNAATVATTVVAHQFTLTVTKAGTGSGRVTSSPAGIDCGATCSAAFDGDTGVTLTATPAVGSSFAGWSGEGCSGTGTCTVAMTQARNVTATFAPLQTFMLTLTKAGTGSGSVTSSPAGIDCGATCAAAFNYNTSVALTATPALGSSFSGWSGEGCSGTGTCTVTLAQARTVTATFTKLQLALTIATNRSDVTIGDSLVISVGVTNPGLPEMADFYFGALLPDGDTVLFFTDQAFHTGQGNLSQPGTLKPIVAKVDLTAPFTFDQPAFFTYQWTGLEPRGTYTLFVAAVVPGALADNTIDPGDVLALSTVTVILRVPNIAVTPLALDFGSAAVGVESAPQTVTVRNGGTATLVVGTLSLAFSISTIQ